MTNLNTEQAELLASVEAQRVAAEPLIEALREQHAQEIWDAKLGIREAAKAAYEAGVPARKIGFALKTSDHNSIKRYIGMED